MLNTNIEEDLWNVNETNGVIFKYGGVRQFAQGA